MKELGAVDSSVRPRASESRREALRGGVPVEAVAPTLCHSPLLPRCPLAVLDGNAPTPSVGSPTSLDPDRCYFVIKGEVAVHVRDPLVAAPAQGGGASLTSPSYAGSTGVSTMSLQSVRPKTSRGGGVVRVVLGCPLQW